MITVLRILLGAALSFAGIVGALFYLCTFRPGVAVACFVGAQLVAALVLPDDPGESVR